MKRIRRDISKANDITLALSGIFALGVIGICMVEPTEIVTVLSYVVTAMGSLATGHALKK